MAPLSVTLDREPRPVGIVTLVGEHDAYSAGRIENELAVLLEAGHAIVIDLHDATFVDSQTLSVLLAARHRAERASLGFVLVLPDDDHTQVHRILEMTGLASAFAIEPELERGVTAARAGRAGGERIRAA
jgi:anti-anti-sigma factor